jgi:4-amino-4-deoxy-L-arabinose transferase-like glycosyltransferase
MVLMPGCLSGSRFRDGRIRRGPRAAEFLIATVLVLIVLTPGIRAPFSRDDLLAVVEIQDIAVRGHWLVNHDEYPERFTVMARDKFGPINRKPPLFYWLSAIVAKALRDRTSPVTTRIVPLAAALALALTTFGWASVWIGTTTGWLALLLLLGSYAYASRATAVLIDMTMTALLFAAWCPAYAQLELNDGSRERALLIGGMLGLASLTKGPVAIALCTLATAIYLIWTKRNPFEFLKQSWSWLALGLALAIPASWLVPALWVVGRDLARVLIEENAGHLLPAAMGGIGESARPVWFTAAHLLGGTFPLCLFLPAALLNLATKDYARDALRPLRYQASLLFATLTIFSVATTKRADYVLPAVAPMAIINAALFTDEIDLSDQARAVALLRDIATGVICAVTLLLIGFVYLAERQVGAPNFVKIALNAPEQVYAQWFIEQVRHPGPVFGILTMISAAAAIAGLVGLYTKLPAMSGFGVALVALSVTTLWTTEITPMRLERQSLAPFVHQVQQLSEGHHLYLAPGYYDREISFELGRYVPYVDATAAAALAAGRSIYVVAMPGRERRLARWLKAQPIEIARARQIIGHDSPVLLKFQPSKSP